MVANPIKEQYRFNDATKESCKCHALADLSIDVNDLSKAEY